MIGGQREQLLAAFQTELDERVRDLTALLLRLEHEDQATVRIELFDALFREAHSLKGAARAVEAPLVERAVHTLESALDSARREESRPNPTWFDATYRAVDAFLPLYQASFDGAEPSAEAVEAIDSLVTDVVVIAANDDPVTVSRSSESVPPGRSPPPPQPSPPPSPSLLSTSDARAGASATGPAVNAKSGGGRTSPELVRVAVDKLDSLLAQAGELTVTQIRIEERVREVRALNQQLLRLRRDGRGLPGVSRSVRPGARRAETTGVVPDRGHPPVGGGLDGAESPSASVLQQVQEIFARLRQDSADLGLLSRALGNEVMALRLVPISTAYGPLERMVRDLARDTGKDVHIALEGGDTDLDRKILEQLRDPLMHMVRNAVDHGIETPSERLAVGKPAMGQLRLTSQQRAGAIEVELTDDGTGIDPASLRKAVVKKGLLTEEQAAALDDRAAIELIFLPGFSTRSTVSETSGRGVGMDVVREHVQRLTGQVVVASVPGQGTRFTIRVPLSLATTRAILLELDEQIFAVPSLMVEWNGRLRERDLVRLEGIPSITLEGVPVPVGELAAVLERTRSAPVGREAGSWRPFVVLRQGERRVALLVDRLVGEQEIVMKPLGWPLRAVRNVAGTTVLGTGQLAVVLNSTDVVRSAWKLLGAASRSEPLASETVSLPRARKLLVVDDSLTTRTLERTILETAGYQVLTASDGADALRLLRANEIALVVSDIDMPNLDGFGLTEEIRRDAALRNLPVILVTSLDAPEHRERGVTVGADAYIVKSDFSQDGLLDTVSRLL